MPEGASIRPHWGGPMRGGTAGFVRDSMRPEAIAFFLAPHEAHLARGRLEAEGILVTLAGEHHPDLTAAGGGVRLEVPAEQADRAREILSRDYSSLLELETGDRLEGEPDRICPACGSASVVDPGAGCKPGLWSILLGAPDHLIGLFGRRFACLTCGRRWR